MRNAVLDAARFLATRAEEPITLADVADHVGYSPYHLARRFEGFMGVPPGQFLAAHRFQRAKRLLLGSDERIIDVCHTVGFTSVGTFTTRFTAAVGSSPTQFRRLPELIAAKPPRPVIVSGSAGDGGVVTGTVRLSPAASGALGDGASIYVGLFHRRAASGFPICGMLLAGASEFTITGVPTGTYWVLSAALPAAADGLAQLLPRRSVQGAAAQPVRVTPASPLQRCDVTLGMAEDWSPPVLIALPTLAARGQPA